MSPRPTIGRGYLGDHGNLSITTPCRKTTSWVYSGRVVEREAVEIDVRPTDQRFTRERESRACGRAARRWPAFEVRDASGVTPCVLAESRRLGRRARYSASRRVLPRVGRRAIVL